jgi:hypothetical protein
MCNILHILKQILLKYIFTRMFMVTDHNNILVLIQCKQLFEIMLCVSKNVAK